MNRRKAIRYLFISGTAIWVLPSCVSESGKAEGLFLTNAQQNLLEDLAETIIPGTTSPGAKELGIHHFIEKMVKDCRTPAYQKTFKTGLDNFNGFVEKEKGKKWSELSTSDKQQMLAYTISAKNNNVELRDAITGVRELTIRGYRSSKYYLTEVQEYKLVPGQFYGCIKIESQAL